MVNGSNLMLFHWRWKCAELWDRTFNLLWCVWIVIYGWNFHLQAKEKEEKKLKAKQKEAARLQVQLWCSWISIWLNRWKLRQNKSKWNACWIWLRPKQPQMEQRRQRKNRGRKLWRMKIQRISLIQTLLMDGRNCLHLRWPSNTVQVQLRNRMIFFFFFAFVEFIIGSTVNV